MKYELWKMWERRLDLLSRFKMIFWIFQGMRKSSENRCTVMKRMKIHISGSAWNGGEPEKVAEYTDAGIAALDGITAADEEHKSFLRELLMSLVEREK